METLCYLCKDKIENELYTCNNCYALYHKDCAEYLESCAVFWEHKDFEFLKFDNLEDYIKAFNQKEPIAKKIKNVFLGRRFHDFVARLGLYAAAYTGITYMTNNDKASLFTIGACTGLEFLVRRESNKVHKITRPMKAGEEIVFLDAKGIDE